MGVRSLREEYAPPASARAPQALVADYDVARKRHAMSIGESLGTVSAVQTPTTNQAIFFMTVLPKGTQVADVKGIG